MALVAELESVRQETDAISARAVELSAGLSEQQLAWRPRPSSWCIAENLLHLERTTHIFLPIIDRALDDARRNGRLGNGPFHLGMMANSTFGTSNLRPTSGSPRQNPWCHCWKGRPQMRCLDS